METAPKLTLVKDVNLTLLSNEYGACNSEGIFFGLTIDLCDVSTTLHSDSDVNSSEALLAQQQHWLQKLKTNTDINTQLLNSYLLFPHIISRPGKATC